MDESEQSSRRESDEEAGDEGSDGMVGRGDRSRCWFAAGVGVGVDVDWVVGRMTLVRFECVRGEDCAQQPVLEPVRSRLPMSACGV